MDSKLTLNVDKSIASRAKKYARSKGRSLSDLVEDYFRFLTRNSESSEAELPPKIKSLLGSIPVPEGFDYKKVLATSLEGKFMKG